MDHKFPSIFKILRSLLLVTRKGRGRLKTYGQPSICGMTTVMSAVALILKPCRKKHGWMTLTLYAPGRQIHQIRLETGIHLWIIPECSYKYTRCLSYTSYSFQWVRYLREDVDCSCCHEVHFHFESQTGSCYFTTLDMSEKGIINVNIWFVSHKIRIIFHIPFMVC